MYMYMYMYVYMYVYMYIYIYIYLQPEWPLKRKVFQKILDFTSISCLLLKDPYFWKRYLFCRMCWSNILLPNTFLPDSWVWNSWDAFVNYLFHNIPQYPCCTYPFMGLSPHLEGQSIQTAWFPWARQFLLLVALVSSSYSSWPGASATTWDEGIAGI